MLPDIRQAIEIIQGTGPEPLRPRVGLGQLAWLRGRSLAEADRALGRGDDRAGLRQLRQAAACVPADRWDWLMRGRYRWALKLAFERAVGLAPGPAPAAPCPRG